MTATAEPTAVRFWFDPVCPCSWTTPRGELVFDHWQRPSSAEYHGAVRAALPPVGLPADPEDAMDSAQCDEAVRLSHGAGAALVGSEVGTPITALDDVAFCGPVLNAIPRGDDAIRVLDGVRLLGGYARSYELERTRVRPPVFT